MNLLLRSKFFPFLVDLIDKEGKTVLTRMNIRTANIIRQTSTDLVIQHHTKCLDKERKLPKMEKNFISIDTSNK